MPDATVTMYSDIPEGMTIPEYRRSRTIRKRGFFARIFGL